MYPRVFISDGSLFPKHKDNNEEPMQGDILLLCIRTFSVKMVVAAWTEELWNCETSSTFTEDRNEEGGHYTCEINSHHRFTVWKEVI